MLLKEQWKEIRELTQKDLKVNLLSSFNRYQEIKRFWIYENNQWNLIDRSNLANWANPKKNDIYFIEEWDEERKTELVKKDFMNTIKNGGSVFGVFLDNGELIAFANLRIKFNEKNIRYLDLRQLHVSYEYRNKGLGKQLFQKCIEKANKLDIKRIFLSTNFSEETQYFYKSVGCVDTKEIDKQRSEEEPFDRQLEYILK